MTPTPPIPAHLSRNEAQGCAENEPIAQFHLGSHRNLVYLIIDWKAKKAAIVDPQSDLEPIYETLKTHHLTLEKILLTHTHHDHVAGVKPLLIKFPELLVYLHAEDAHRLETVLTTFKNRVHFLKDQDILKVGQTKVQVLHTPGHSAGEVCYYLEDSKPPYLFTGDTLFIRDCGRTDFETGSDEAMFKSLQKIKALSPDSIILPGHHYQKETASTLRAELQTSPPLKCTSVAELKGLP